MNFLLDRFCELPEAKEFLRAIEQNSFPAALTGLSHIHSVTLIAASVKAAKIKPLVITEDEATAERIIEDLSSLSINALFFPAKDYNLRSVTASLENERARIGVLSKILDGNFEVIVCTAEAASGITIPQSSLKEHSLKLKVGKEYSENELVKRLVAGGYTRTEQVESVGQFAIRGGIFDLFSPGSDLPFRIDFFGDEIDSISLFEPDSQRRTESVRSVEISPCLEICPENKDSFTENLKELYLKQKSDAARKRIETDLERLSANMPICYDPYSFLIFEKNCFITDYFASSPIFILETNSVLSRVDAVYSLHTEEIKNLSEDGLLCNEFSPLYKSRKLFEETLATRKTVFADSFAKSAYPVTLEKLIRFAVNEITAFSGNISSLATDIKEFDNNFTLILAGGEQAAKNICERLIENGVKARVLTKNTKAKSGVYVSEGTLSSGMELPFLKFCLIVHSKATKQVKKAKYKIGKAVGSLEELSVGDYVVHATHGIGRYLGINQIKSGGITRDYIKIAYRDNASLYVPVTSLDMVSKYVGTSEDSTVRLNKLGSNEWKNTKQRVKASVKEMAKKLTELYAKRMQIKGFAFSQDCDMQSDFEGRFLYEETDDQLRCINEIKNDMELSSPMDRLLCGDVGFGKTEVALRAAFKCILDGKQCAILVPTTILAWQHYNTALERFSGIPVNIEMLSRFRKPKQQEKIRKELSVGNIDLIIGTHSLIADSTAFKDLGLIIVDEEQRFGVAQKEKLKEKYPAVDVLTLSATPIPRTLNMALSGLRDMSSLEEAPLNRQPVQTYVCEQDDNMLLEVMRRELKRNGQVYYLHNRTENIESVAKALQSKLPDAAIGVAHGKMSEEELSFVWKQLIEHKIDILVCTTIIETGVDVPNVNTLIIEDADRMGLSQLHQLRGRVGRSHRRAFAYFVYRAGKSLSEISRKRLDAIRQFTEFGSGFRIAMRDLEIRGAGNVLGGEQHGHLEAVGYDMYIKMLSVAIAEEKGEIREEKQDCLIDIRMSSHIPEKYISSLTQRLSVYRRIADVSTEEDKLDIIDELIDRYGDPPKEILGLIRVSMLRNKAAALGFGEIKESFGNLIFTPTKNIPQMLSLADSELKNSIRFSRDELPKLTVKLENNASALSVAEKVLELLVNTDS